jgi:hypothetical protein
MARSVVSGFLGVTCQIVRCRSGARYQVRDLAAGDTVYVCGEHFEDAEELLGAAWLLPVCEQCGADMPVPERAQGGGRTKRFCSGRCRTAAHRARPAAWAADTIHAVAGVERA